MPRGAPSATTSTPTTRPTGRPCRPSWPPRWSIVHRVIDTFRIPSLSLPGVEADDVIATLACRAAQEGMRVVICSSDKDLMQLCDDRINLLDTMKNRLLGPAEVQEKFGVPPEQVGDVLALMGDSIDNVPGVAGHRPQDRGRADQPLRLAGGPAGARARGEGQEGRGAGGRARGDPGLAQAGGAATATSRCPSAPPSCAGRTSIAAALVSLFRELEFARLIVQERLTDPVVAVSAAAAARPRASCRLGGRPGGRRPPGRAAGAAPPRSRWCRPP